METCTNPNTNSTSRNLKHPPVDGTLTADQLYEWNAIHSPDIPCFLWTEGPPADSKKKTMNWKEVGVGIDRAVACVERGIIELGIPGVSVVNTNADIVKINKPIMVGILSSADILTYSMFLLALMRLTHVTDKQAGGLPFPILPFPMSTRNSPTVIAHLIRATKMQYIYVSEGPMRDLLDKALQNEPHDKLAIKVLTMPVFSELYPLDLPSSAISSVISPPATLDSPAVILHSSGSTAFPKPITLTHRTLLEWTRALGYGGMKWEDETMALHASPVFHAMGMIGIVWSAANLFIRAIPPPSTNSPPPTPDYFLSQIVASRATMLSCVPSFLEAWAEDAASVEVLKKLKVVVYAGAPLSVKAGSFLHQNGVNIRCHLGATEFGQVTLYPPTTYSEGHEWFALSPIVHAHFEPQDEENVFELVFKEAPGHHLSVHNTIVDGIPAYASSDLVERHPFNKALLKIVGRKDDQIMLSTGEKTNPGPLEHIINRSDAVKCAVFFGRGRLQNGVIIEPESWDNFTTVEAFRDTVWPHIEEANVAAPSHSRIFKEMILVAYPKKPFTYTAKGTPRLGGIVKDYEPEIEALYATIEESSQIDILAPSTQIDGSGWTVSDATDFIRRIISRVVKNAKILENHTDLFEAGCDSLEATYIRNSILRGLRESAPMCQVHKIPTDFVYQHPTIEQLGMYVAQVSQQANAIDVNAFASEEERRKQMDEMVWKYTKDFPTHVASYQTGSEATAGEVILLTGSTGGLGSQILAQLVALPTVVTIYAFNRPTRSGKTSRDRQHGAFVDRGNPPNIVDSEKIRFVEGDTSVEGLGIPEDLLDEIRTSVSTIIHNAWVVDFKVSLATLESAVRGVRNLVDFALHSPHQEPPRLMFISSIGILRKWLPGRIPEAPVVDSTLINSSGYGSSKWISERVLLIAAAATPLRPVIIRMGQLTGGLNGCWNIPEWFPTLVRGSQMLGCMPDNKGVVSWVPLAAAATAVIELRNTSSLFAHIVHPRPVPWTVIAQSVAQLLDISLVPYTVWVSALKLIASNDAEESKTNPALRLLEFYMSSEDPTPGIATKEAMGMPSMVTTKTVEQAPSFRGDTLPRLGKEDVQSWISYWRQNQFLEYMQATEAEVLI